MIENFGDMVAHSSDIEIDVRTRYLPDQSVPGEKRYVFAYTITISNNGDEDVQLVHRHWQITDANNKVHEVNGRGVVGETPLIAAGESFQYTSGTLLETEVGSMQGSYDMVSASGTAFSALIHPFSLALPGVVH
ncbi:MAG: Co2+/Mg2+ efflux protein ApaG [Spongiibacteraceae bacterium]